jgi:hypothetical protein
MDNTNPAFSLTHPIVGKGDLAGEVFKGHS